MPWVGRILRPRFTGRLLVAGLCFCLMSSLAFAEPLMLKAQPQSPAKEDVPSVSGSWRTIATKARFYHTATLLPNGTVLVAGGCLKANSGGCLVASDSAEIYDPARHRWSRTAEMGTARIGHTATLLPSGKVLVAGGCIKPPSGSGCFPDNESPSAELYDPIARTWAKTPDMVQAHIRHTATMLPKGPRSICGTLCGKVLVVGSGFLPQVLNALTSDHVEIYDPVKNVWTRQKPTVEARVAHTATLLSDGKVMVVGGGAITNPTAVAELFDPRTGEWRPAGEGEPSPRTYGHASTLLRSGRVLVSGGTGLGIPCEKCSRYGSDSTQIYNPKAPSDPAHPEIKAGAWAVGRPIANNRQIHTATSMRNGNVMVVGGSSPALAQGTPAITPEVYRQDERRWLRAPVTRYDHPGAFQTGAAPFPSAHTATLLEDGSLLVVGGAFKSGQPVGAAEIFTPQKEGAGVGDRRPFSWPIWTAVGALVLVAGAGFLLRRRKQQTR